MQQVFAGRDRRLLDVEEKLVQVTLIDPEAIGHRLTVKRDLFGNQTIALDLQHRAPHLFEAGSEVREYSLVELVAKAPIGVAERSRELQIFTTQKIGEAPQRLDADAHLPHLFFDGGTVFMSRVV